MAWPNWQAAALPCRVESFPFAPWAHLIPNLPLLQRKLRVALPCIGLSGISEGMWHVGWKGMEIIHAYDIDTELIPAMLARHDPEIVQRFNIGPSGNLLHLDITKMEDVDMIIAGPPCPPFSSIGSKKGWNDERSRVFSVVHNMLKDQYQRKSLKAFIVEMVPGMDQERNVGSSTSWRVNKTNLYQTWLRRLREDLRGFKVVSWVMQSSNYLPQHRVRIYTVGICVEILGNRVMIQPVLPSIATSLRTTLKSTLSTELLALCEHSLTGQQRANLMTMKQQLLAKRLPGEPLSCCISVDRDPNMTFGEYYRKDGCVCTLRTQNEMLWILMVDCSGKVTLSRCLHPVERLSLQGFHPELAKTFSKKALLRVTGNACTVPVITSVFGQLLCLLAEPYVLGLPDVPRPLSMWTHSQSALVIASHYHNMLKYISILCSLVAILQQLVQLEVVKANVPGGAHDLSSDGPPAYSASISCHFACKHLAHDDTDNPCKRTASLTHLANSTRTKRMKVEASNS